MDKNNRYLVKLLLSLSPLLPVSLEIGCKPPTLNFQKFKGILGITWALQKVNFASFYPKELHSSDINRKPCENKYILKHHAKLRGQQMQTTVWH